MAIEQTAPLQEEATGAQATPEASEELERSLKIHDAEVAEVFAWGYADYHDAPSERSHTLYDNLHKLGKSLPPGFVEAKGRMSGLTDRLYMRRDRAEHSASIAVAAWAQKFARIVPVDLISQALLREKDADKKPTIAAILSTALSHDPDLTRELSGVIATSHARLSAEGTTAAGTVLNLHRGAPVPDLDNTNAAELSSVQRTGSYRANVPSTASLILAGLAGDLVIHGGHLINTNQGGRLSGAIPLIVAAAAGAIFYLGMTSHQSYTNAQLVHLQNAGEKVDFVTVGDGRVCPECAAAEAGNPYAPDAAPPIPQHGGCRCWYAAAGAIT